MTSPVLSMPDEPAERSGWLDRQLAGTDLARLVAELSVLRDIGRAPESRVRFASVDDVRRWLAADLDAVLARGLRSLSPERLVELTRMPQLLPGLQELVLTAGSDHWERLVVNETPLPERRPAASDMPANGIGVEAAGEERLSAPPVTTPSAGRHGDAASRFPRMFAALAAGLLIAVAIWQLQPRQSATPWGWNHPAALAAKPPGEYLEGLATAAEEWSAEVPRTEAALDGRLRDLLAGCDRLIAAPHESLEPADREWLVERCRAWREKIEGHLASLGTSHDVAAVRNAADATVGKLVAALKARAGESTRGRGAS